MRIPHAAAFCLLLLAVAPAVAQFPDPASRIAAQREAMARISFIDGVWRGPAWSLTPAGRTELVQVERIGPFLDGSVRVIEGRGYMSDGSIGFNALGVISYDPDTRSYSLTSWAMGRQGTFPLRMTEDGFVWEAPAGPGAIMRYTTTVRDGSWLDVGEYVAGDAPPRRVVELNLSRVGDTDWPAAGAVPQH